MRKNSRDFNLPAAIRDRENDLAPRGIAWNWSRIKGSTPPTLDLRIVGGCAGAIWIPFVKRKDNVLRQQDRAKHIRGRRVGMLGRRVALRVHPIPAQQQPAFHLLEGESSTNNPWSVNHGASPHAAHRGIAASICRVSYPANLYSTLPTLLMTEIRANTDVFSLPNATDLIE
jgi:hypothetical protein